jgi:5'-3' exonuclease
MIVHVVDGTYELFRHFYGMPEETRNGPGRELDAVRGVMLSILRMLEEGATHVGVATDHVIESFRNDLWPGYKTGEGMDPVLLAQFGPLEDGLRAMGVVVWPMVDLEADDALAAAARIAANDPRVERVLICTPDKDLAQSVRGTRVVQLDRRKNEVRDELGVQLKFGVSPGSIPDWLALVGDAADGYPGIKGWGAKSAATVLARYQRLEDVPRYAHKWDVPVRGAVALATRLDEDRDLAILFKDLATLRSDAPVIQSVDELRWCGPSPGLGQIADKLRVTDLSVRVARLSESRG